MVEWAMGLSAELKSFCRAAGADLAGIADLGPLKEGLPAVPPDILLPYNRALSLAVRLDDDVVDDIADHPTTVYAGLYRSINARLDGIAERAVGWIVGNGFTAKAIPASFIADEEELLGAVSHKAVARMAGIGWQGKSLLIVSPQFGPRIRLVTVLTDTPLEADEPLSNRCGACRECSKACPASAIRNISTKSHYADRHEALFFDRCAAKTFEFSKLPGIGARICGVCVRACPFGKKRGAAGKSEGKDRSG